MNNDLTFEFEKMLTESKQIYYNGRYLICFDPYKLYKFHKLLERQELTK